MYQRWVRRKMMMFVCVIDGERVSNSDTLKQLCKSSSSNPDADVRSMEQGSRRLPRHSPQPLLISRKEAKSFFFINVLNGGELIRRQGECSFHDRER